MLKDRQISLRLPSALYESLARIAEAESRSVANLIQIYLVRGVELQEAIDSATKKKGKK